MHFAPHGRDKLVEVLTHAPQRSARRRSEILVESEGINLEPLNEKGYEDFMRALQIRYARDRMESNLLSKEEAIEFTQKQWSSFLPQGQSTEGHFFFSLEDSQPYSGFPLDRVDDLGGVVRLPERIG